MFTRMRLKGIVFAAAAAGLAAACSSEPKVVAEANPAANFAAYRTYNWVPTDHEPPEGLRFQGTQDWRVRSAVEGELGSRSLVKAASPGLLVDYGVSFDRETTKTFGDYARYVNEGGRGGLADAYVLGYEQVTVILHLYDARTGELVWRASATAMVDGDDNGERTRRAIHEMIAQLPRG